MKHCLEHQNLQVLLTMKNSMNCGDDAKHVDLDGEDEESPCGGEKTGYGISVEIVQQPKK